MRLKKDDDVQCQQDKDRLDGTKVKRSTSYVSEMGVAQCRFSSRESNTPASTGPTTGLPQQLKNGLELLSGYDMSPVRVHYNSPKPAVAGALAYAQGRDIFLDRGQERHLPHESWHVVQQMQGRVTAKRQMQGLDVNDDCSLEREADVMGNKAVSLGTKKSPSEMQKRSINTQANTQPVQRKKFWKKPGFWLGALATAGLITAATLTGGVAVPLLAGGAGLAALYTYYKSGTRDEERALAQQTMVNADVQAALRRCLERLAAHFPRPDDGVDRFDSAGRYGYSYSPRYGIKRGGRKHMRAEMNDLCARVNLNPTDKAFYDNIVALFVGVSRIVKDQKDITGHFQNGKSSSLHEAEQQDDMAGVSYRTRIEGHTNRMRKYFPRRFAVNSPVYTPGAAKISGMLYRFNSVNGPSATTLHVLNLAKYVGCSRAELRALAWGLFSWWRTHNRPKAYHTFKETMVILNAYLGENFFAEVPREVDISGTQEPAPAQQPQNVLS